jgi:hypothetical protein
VAHHAAHHHLHSNTLTNTRQHSACCVNLQSSAHVLVQRRGGLCSPTLPSLTCAQGTPGRPTSQLWPKPPTAACHSHTSTDQVGSEEACGGGDACVWACVCVCMKVWQPASKGCFGAAQARCMPLAKPRPGLLVRRHASHTATATHTPPLHKPAHNPTSCACCCSSRMQAAVGDGFDDFCGPSATEPLLPACCHKPMVGRSGR